MLILLINKVPSTRARGIDLLNTCEMILIIIISERSFQNLNIRVNIMTNKGNKVL